MIYKTAFVPFRRHALVLALALVTGAPHAANIDLSASCTLVNAINNANTDTDTDGTSGCPAGSGNDTINLLAGKIYTLTKADNQFEGSNGLPLITSRITINGNGAAISRAQTANTADFRILSVAAQGDLLLNDVKLTGGKISGEFQYGAGLRNAGQLSLNNATISGNSIRGTSSSGAIANMYGGKLTMVNSTITNNSGERNGGIANFPGANAAVFSSTISANRSVNGGVGGIANGGVMALTNSTVSGNRNQGEWGTGGIVNDGNSAARLIIKHSTIAGNSTRVGNVAGIHLASGRMTLFNSIVASSTGGSDCYGGPTTTTLLQGRNFFTSGTCSNEPYANAKLLPLLDNGGLTLTHALHPKSLAVDAAASECAVSDQRAIKRQLTANSACDVGSFERLASKPASVLAILKTFDDNITNGGLLGVGDGKVIAHTTGAFRNQLLVAGSYRDRKQNDQACVQALSSLRRIDTNNSPDANDYVTGNGAAALSAELKALRKTWACQN